MNTDNNTQEKSTAREKLIATGMQLLMENGNETLSNRMLAQKANVNHANINYHFKNRQGLNKAILEFALKEWNACFDGILETTKKQIAVTDKTNLEPIVRQFISQVLTVLTCEKNAKFLAVLFNGKLELSEQSFRERFFQVLAPFYRLTAVIVAKCTGINQDDVRCTIHSQIIVAQCMTFFRGQVLFQNQKIDLNSSEIQKILIQTVTDSILASLGFAH